MQQTVCIALQAFIAKEINGGSAAFVSTLQFTAKDRRFPCFETGMASKANL
jgi:hypothetical protein